MTVSSSTNRFQYTGNGVTTSFAFSNIFFALTDLVVTLYDTTAEAAVSPAPVLNGLATYDYTITATLDTDTGEYPSGTVVFNTAPPSNYRVTIERVVPETQAVVLIDNSKFPANTVNGALDRLTILVQRCTQLLGQALRYPSSDPTTQINTLPGYQERASMFLAFDSSGNPIASPGPSATGQPISTFWATLIQLSTAVLSRTALAVPGLADNNTYTGSNAFITQSAGNSSTLAATTAFVAAAATATAALQKSWIYGWAYANAAGDVTNDLDIAAGGGADSTGAVTITGAALTKQSDVAWAVGNAAGMLDTGAVGNSDYYLWAIMRTDLTVVDYLCSLSSTAPTMPANYTYKRLIGWFKRSGGLIVLFKTYEIEGGGLELLWSSPTLDINSAALTTARLLSAVKVPLNVSTTALINTVIVNGGTDTKVRVCCPDQADVAPDVAVAPLNSRGYFGASGAGYGEVLRVRTNNVGQIAARATVAVTGWLVATEGFTWSRR